MRTIESRAASPCGVRTQFIAVLPVLLVTAMLVSAGCATVGKDFPASRVSEIEIGKTSRDEIRAMFGPPWRVGIEDGQRTWTYGKYRYELFAEKNAQDLVIRFDDNNVVVSYTFSTTEHDE